MMLPAVFCSCEHNDETEPEDILDLFSGEYLCNIKSCSVNTDTWQQNCNTFIDTVKVTKVSEVEEEGIDNDIRKLKISGLNWGSYCSENIVDFDLTDSSFQNVGQRVYGRFYFDSIYVHTQISPAALWSGTYVGKKIIN